MSSILNVLQHTPWWVFAVFALLTWLGAQALRPRKVPVWRLLITPVIFIGWGVTSLVIQSTSAPILVAHWSAAAVVGAAIAWTTSRFDSIKIDRVQRQVSRPGSLLIFSAKYGLGAAAAMMPAWRSDLALWDIAVSGASAGYFLGWLARLAQAYRRAAEPNLTEQVPVSAAAWRR
jgi:hypothetical protein